MNRNITKVRLGRSSLEGQPEKSDLIVEVEPSPSLIIDINSSVLTLYRKHLEKVVSEIVKEYHFQEAKITVNDDGALDFTIKARLKAALCMARESSVQPVDSSHPPLASINKNIVELKSRLRRTRLYLPGNNPYLMQNAYLFGSDALIFDLEDSVSPSEKLPARYLISEALNFLPLQDQERMVRINPLDGEGIADLRVVMRLKNFDTVLLPKCECSDDILNADKIISYFEREYNYGQKQLALIPLIETAKGVLNAPQIAAASKRNVALTFGAEDFTADMGISRSQQGEELLWAKGMILMAAKANGLQALDTVYSDISNPQGLEQDTITSKSLGFDGRGIIHPEQIDIVHRVYQPSPSEIEYSQRVVDALEKARTQGNGVASLGRKMIDAPVEARALKTIKLARKLNLI